MKPRKCILVSEVLIEIHAAIHRAVCQELLLSANFDISPSLESKLYEYVMQLEQARKLSTHASCSRLHSLGVPRRLG